MAKKARGFRRGKNVNVAQTAANIAGAVQLALPYFRDGGTVERLTKTISQQTPSSIANQFMQDTKEALAPKNLLKAVAAPVTVKVIRYGMSSLKVPHARVGKVTII